MSDLAKRIDATAYAEMLIQQWRRVPRMQALMEALLEVVDVHLVKPLVDMERTTMIGTAEGVWLDYIGERLGVVGRQPTWAISPSSGSREAAALVSIKACLRL